MERFKPNIYPIIYWGLLYGLIAGFVLLIIFFLSKYLTTIWFPVFLAGLIWGGYSNYKKQKSAWSKSAGVGQESGSALDEMKEAVGDIVSATKDLLAEQDSEDKVSSQEVEKRPSQPLADQGAVPSPPAPPKDDVNSGPRVN
mgnify:CR=1 FL=1